jgi:hypothetical protein
MLTCLFLLALALVTIVRAQMPGSIVEVGNTAVSAMMVRATLPVSPCRITHLP